MACIAPIDFTKTDKTTTKIMTQRQIELALAIQYSHSDLPDYSKEFILHYDINGLHTDTFISGSLFSLSGVTFSSTKEVNEEYINLMTEKCKTPGHITNILVDNYQNFLINKAKQHFKKPSMVFMTEAKYIVYDEKTESVTFNEVGVDMNFISELYMEFVKTELAK